MYFLGTDPALSFFYSYVVSCSAFSFSPCAFHGQCCILVIRLNRSWPMLDSAVISSSLPLLPRTMWSSALLVPHPPSPVLCPCLLLLLLNSWTHFSSPYSPRNTSIVFKHEFLLFPPWKQAMDIRWTKMRNSTRLTLYRLFLGYPNRFKLQYHVFSLWISRVEKAVCI
jgi:hypothetical protein